MATDAPATLTPDIQEALQKAVGEANKVAHSIKKKFKRVRTEDPTDSNDLAESHQQKKKKKSKHAVQEQLVSSAPNVTVPEHSIEPVVAAAPDVSPDTAVKKKKKNSKGKEKATHVDAAPADSENPAFAGPPPEHPANLDVATSSEDFISAVVAAASATSNAPMDHPPPYEQHIPPYMGYPGEFSPYPYPQHGHQPPFDPSQHAQPMFPDSSMNLPDLNFASNEDLIRSIQDFDLSKVMSVLKTLGEAAAAASVVYNPGPLFVPRPPRAPPVVNPRAAKSDSILGRPPRAPRFVQPSATTGSQNEAGDIAYDNPDHAHMLANVWMNTQKLNEMVKSEGTFSC